jgi:hypothetical protein
MNHATAILIGKLIDAAKAKKAIEPGEHVVDETVVLHVSGQVNKGEDYDQEIVLKADPWTLLLAALSHTNGVTIESIAREALTADPKLVKSIKKDAKDAMAAINATTMTHCSGKTTIKKGAELTVVASQAEAV